MAIELPPTKLKQMQASIRRYASEHLDEEMGDLKAGLMLDFVMKELAPTIYNQGVSDAQAWMQGKLTDMDGECAEDEFGYWPPNSKRHGR